MMGVRTNQPLTHSLIHSDHDGAVPKASNCLGGGIREENTVPIVSLGALPANPVTYIFRVWGRTEDLTITEKPELGFISQLKK